MPHSGAHHTCMATGGARFVVAPSFTVEIPSDFDPYFDRLSAPRAFADGMERCVVRIEEDRKKDVCLHVEDGNVRAPSCLQPRFRGSFCQRHSTWVNLTSGQPAHTLRSRLASDMYARRA